MRRGARVPERERAQHRHRRRQKPDNEQLQRVADFLSPPVGGERRALRADLVYTSPALTVLSEFSLRIICMSIRMDVQSVYIGLT